MTNNQHIDCRPFGILTEKAILRIPLKKKSWKRESSVLLRALRASELVSCFFPYNILLHRGKSVFLKLGPLQRCSCCTNDCMQVTTAHSRQAQEGKRQGDDDIRNVFIRLVLRWGQPCERPFLIDFTILYRIAEFLAGSLIPVFYSALHSNTINFLCTPWQYCRVCGLDFPTSLVISGMRGAKAGVRPMRRRPPCTEVDFSPRQRVS